MRSPMDENTFMNFYKNTVLGYSNNLQRHICRSLEEQHRITFEVLWHGSWYVYIAVFDFPMPFDNLHLSETASSGSLYPLSGILLRVHQTQSYALQAAWTFGGWLQRADLWCSEKLSLAMESKNRWGDDRCGPAGIGARNGSPPAERPSFSHPQSMLSYIASNLYFS